jgi:hypothetical protein
MQNTMTQAQPITIRLEWVAVLALALFSLVLRLASLDVVPMNPVETAPALAAWRSVSPDASGSALVADSPLVFWSQRLAFGLLGGELFTARMLTALAGVALGLTPLLFRDLLGQNRVLILALLLTVSPLILTASRMSSEMVWALLLALLGLWAVWRFSVVRLPAYGIGATVLFGAMAFLSGPGGLLLTVILIAAAALALWLMPEGDDTGDRLALLRDWPWRSGLLVAALVVAVVSTGFLLYLSGLSMLGELLNTFLTGLTQSQPDAPLFFPLLVALFYEPWLWLLAGVGVFMLVRQDRMTLIERFLAMWVVVGVIVSVVYAGGTADNGLWLVVPLAGLPSAALSYALEELDVDLLWIGDFFGDEHFSLATARSAKWIVGAVVFGLLVIAALHFQIAMREFLTVPGGSLSDYLDRVSVRQPEPSPGMSLIWFLMSLLFIVVGGFFAASIWGNEITVQGLLIGFGGFLVLSAVAVGWTLAVTRSGQPEELYYTEATSEHAGLLRDTLEELAYRETMGYPMIPVAVMAPDTGVVAWAVRDFSNAYFIADVEQAWQEQVILIPETAMMVSSEPGALRLPELGGSYLGQRFVMTYRWSSDFLEGFDFLPWWGMRETRIPRQVAQAYILWLRQDIYDSAPYQSAPVG